MFRYLLSGGSLGSYAVSLLLTLPVLLFSLSAHEAAHAAAAYLMGDPTARNFGRMTLNPLKHLNPMGTLCMLFCGFGWANPVPVDSRNFRKPRLGIAVTALAGPLANLLLSVVSLCFMRFLCYGFLWQLNLTNETAVNAVYFLTLLFYYRVYMNLTLAIFNLLPVPPLDGSRILLPLLPPRLTFRIARYERQIVLVVTLLLLLGPLSWLISFVTDKLLLLLFRLFGMSGFLIS